MESLVASLADIVATWQREDPVGGWTAVGSFAPAKAYQTAGVAHSHDHGRFQERSHDSYYSYRFAAWTVRIVFFRALAEQGRAARPAFVLDASEFELALSRHQGKSQEGTYLFTVASHTAKCHASITLIHTRRWAMTATHRRLRDGRW